MSIPAKRKLNQHKLTVCRTTSNRYCIYEKNKQGFLKSHTVGQVFHLLECLVNPISLCYYKSNQSLLVGLKEGKVLELSIENHDIYLKSHAVRSICVFEGVIPSSISEHKDGLVLVADSSSHGGIGELCKDVGSGPGDVPIEEN